MNQEEMAERLIYEMEVAGLEADDDSPIEVLDILDCLGCAGLQLSPGGEAGDEYIAIIAGGMGA